MMHRIGVCGVFGIPCGVMSGILCVAFVHGNPVSCLGRAGTQVPVQGMVERNDQLHQHELDLEVEGFAETSYGVD